MRRFFGLLVVVLSFLGFGNATGFLVGQESELLPQKSTKNSVARGKTDENNRADDSGRSLTEKASYLLGYNLIREFQLQGIDLDVERAIAGLRDAAEGKKPPMSAELIRSVEEGFQKLVMDKQHALFREAAERNKREELEFLEENAKKEGVKQTESGLQYKVVKSGTGATPKVGDVVRFHFKGYFPNGTELESSGEEPMRYRIGTSIMPGLAEALSLMKAGDRWIIYMPSKLAFGIQGSPPQIGPNQILVYELELVDVTE